MRASRAFPPFYDSSIIATTLVLRCRARSRLRRWAATFARPSSRSPFPRQLPELVAMSISIIARLTRTAISPVFYRRGRRSLTGAQRARTSPPRPTSYFCDIADTLEARRLSAAAPRGTRSSLSRCHDARATSTKIKLKFPPAIKVPWRRRCFNASPEQNAFSPRSPDDDDERCRAGWRRARGDFRATPPSASRSSSSAHAMAPPSPWPSFGRRKFNFSGPPQSQAPRQHACDEIFGGQL